MSEILTHRLRLDAFAELGQILKNPGEQLIELINSAKHYNAWFSPENTLKAVQSIASMLNPTDLERWPENPGISKDEKSQRSVGLILAGNIPLVGFHDILCILASGHKALIKLSSQDQKLIPFILQQLIALYPGFVEQIEYVDRLKDFDAVIATGSNNTSRYFEYYFSRVPHIIRKNRNSIAVLSGDENRAQLESLGHDIFDYFGLGCRNVSKIYVPTGYNLRTLFEAIEKFSPVIDHHKYHNNYDYNKSIFLVNQDKHLDNGFLLVKEDKRLASPLAVLYYEEYGEVDKLAAEIGNVADQIQCIVSEATLPLKTIGFGESQQPKLWDYADGVDTMAFLREL